MRVGTGTPGGGHRSPGWRLGRLIGWIVAAPLALAVIGWETLFVYYSNLPAAARLPVAITVGLLSLGTALMGLRRAKWALGFAAVFCALLLWFFSIRPSNGRDWQPDVARLAWAEVSGDVVTVHDIRNFDYRSEFDYTPAYYDRQFDLRRLESVDAIAVYWMGPAIAHVFLSFGFADGSHLAFSIETRKEKGEAYSTVEGFFRHYELYYVVADERDVIRLRTNYRKDPPEDVYVYRVRGPIENARRLFLAYIGEINALKARPEFYNTLTTNCTTTIWMNTHVNPGRLPFSWKILASGYVPEYLYEMGLLDRSLPFAEIQRRAHVNARARAADAAADFSRLIRAD